MNSSYSQTTTRQIKSSCLLQLTTSPTLYQQTSSMETGTFYTSPTQFTQLYTLHAMVDDVMYPLVFGLIPGKSEEIYDRYFNLLKTTCQQHQLQLTPQIFFTETATHNSAQRVSIFTCHFEKLLLPLSSMHLEKDTETWTHHHLQRQQRRPTIRKTSSSSTTGTHRS